MEKVAQYSISSSEYIIWDGTFYTNFRKDFSRRIDKVAQELCIEVI